MHLSDALVSPAIGLGMLGVSVGMIGYSVHKVQKNFDNRTIPLMGVMGAFVFAAQMINFAIPGTGSSGHICGAMLLSILLGPAPAFLVLSGVLAIQAILFADGGLLALGCNIFNLGFWGCFVAYPFIYKPITANHKSNFRNALGTILSTIVALQLGALSVVIETMLSYVTELSFGTFALLMQPIHLAIGAVEGILTALTLQILYRARPQLQDENTPYKRFSFSMLVVSILGFAVLCGGVFSLYASSHPDGLEWAIEHSTSREVSSTDSVIHQTSSSVQEKIALMPDYAFKNSDESSLSSATVGVIGTLVTLVLVGLMGVIVAPKMRQKKL